MSKIYDYAIQQPKVTSNFGWRDCPFHGREHHDGVDLISGTGNRNLFAIEEGYVHIVQNSNSGYGNRIWIRYPRINKSVMYAHCEKIYSKKGDKVKKGDVVAYEGKTGNATGVHLHFGMTDIGSDTWINPQTYDYEPPYREDLIIKPVERDKNKYQLKVLGDGVKVKFYPSNDTETRGHVLKDKIYDIKGSAKNHGDWYQIDDIQWILNEKNLEIYPLQNDNKELEKEIEQLQEKVSNIETLNQALQEENNKLANDLDKFSKIYTCEKNDYYNFKIKMYKNESLYIK